MLIWIFFSLVLENSCFKNLVLQLQLTAKPLIVVGLHKRNVVKLEYSNNEK